MNRYLRSVAVAALSVSFATFAFAQTPPPSSNTQPETPPSSGAEPSSASSPHQRQATGDTKAMHEQMMKDCVTKQRANNTGMSESQAKSACKEQMKSSSSDKNY